MDHAGRRAGPPAGGEGTQITCGVPTREPHEYKTAERLKKDYWLYVVFNCASAPQVHLIQDPARLGWEPLVKIEHYHVGAKQILEASDA